MDNLVAHGTHALGFKSSHGDHRNDGGQHHFFNTNPE